MLMMSSNHHKHVGQRNCLCRYRQGLYLLQLQEPHRKMVALDALMRLQYKDWVEAFLGREFEKVRLQCCSTLVVR